MKIRGTAAHVCEKYQQLARDAISAGDRVMAENYYQHAEHYYRLLMASQVVNDGQPRPQNALGYRPDEDQEEDEDDFGAEQPQPNFPNQPYHQQQPQQSHGPRNNPNGGSYGRGFNNNQGPDRQGSSDGRGPDRPQEQPIVAAEGETDGADQAAGGEFQGNGGGQGPDGQRRPGRGRRRRQRHDQGGTNAGGDRHEGVAVANGSDGGGEAAPSAGGGEAPVV